jgi:hypothetical protein
MIERPKDVTLLLKSASSFSYVQRIRANVFDGMGDTMLHLSLYPNILKLKSSFHTILTVNIFLAFIFIGEL